MRIDITSIAGINGAYMMVSENVSADVFGTGIMGIELEDCVHADLKIEYIEGIIFAKGNMSGYYKAQCGRCLKDIKEKFDIEIDESFIHISANTDTADDYLYEGNQLDLTIPMIDNIMLSFPGVMLCSDTCRGLCNICGVDLNIEQCTCEKQEINIKMEKLKDFFNQ